MDECKKYLVCIPVEQDVMEDLDRQSGLCGAACKRASDGLRAAPPRAGLLRSALPPPRPDAQDQEHHEGECYVAQDRPVCGGSALLPWPEAAPSTSPPLSGGGCSTWRRRGGGWRTRGSRPGHGHGGRA